MRHRANAMSAGPDRCLPTTDAFLPTILANCRATFWETLVHQGEASVPVAVRVRVLNPASYTTSCRRRLRVSDGIANLGLLSVRSILLSETA